MFKKGDFVKLNYTGYVIDNMKCIDTTKEEIAKQNHMFVEDYDYEPVVVCIGHHHIIKGIDYALENKNPNEKLTLEIEPEDAFGKKSNQIKSVPLTSFKEQKQRPMLGDQFMYGDKLATVKFTSNRMVMLDFNHPFSGYRVKYDIEILNLVEDKKEQLKAIVKHEMKIPKENYNIELKDDILTLTIKSEEIPEDIRENIKKHILEMIKAKDLIFAFEKPN